MAVRDRNLFAWQAYVITMAFVSVGLLLGMFFLWRSYSDLSKKYDDQSTQLSTARSEFQTSEGRVDRLLSMMGVGENTEQELNDMASRFAADEKLAEIEKEFQVQMNLFDPNVAASEKNLMKLPKYLLDTVRARNNDIDAAREREAKLLADMTATVQRESKARQDAEAAQKKAEADLEDTRQKHAAAIAKLNSEKEEALKKFDAYKNVIDQQMARVSAENRQLKDENQKQAETIATQMDIINQFRNPDFAAPQGEIIKTANGGTTVWVNLGRDDGLREGVPFSVIDESAVNISEAVPKAKLVVMRVIKDHPHMCMAKVTDYNPSQPIVTGDKVYSPAWRPGRTVGFALVGMMDWNGDRRDDAEQVREKIRQSGGQIDAEMDSKGNVIANLPGMSPNTSFLVTGSDLNLSAGATPEQQAKAEQYAKFIAEARTYGIQQISLDKLMGYLKVEATDRTVPLGSRISGQDFPIRPAVSPPTSNGDVSEIFQKRSP
jgi:hypothetical protein